MEEQTIITAVLDFTSDPGPRYCKQGDDSGEEFYHTVLNGKFYEAITAGKKLLVKLDGTEGYASSFLDESFGNLIYDFTLEKVKNTLLIESKEEPHWKSMLINESFPQWETRRVNNEEPNKTAPHDNWYRLCDGDIKTGQWYTNK